MFTFDIGKGKGHGHTNGATGVGNDRETGFVVGNGGSGDISNLRGEPVARDGTRRRYDRRTQSGHGAPNKPSDYAVGDMQNAGEGVYGYDQAADMQAQPSRRPSRGGRRGPPKRGGARKPMRGGAKPTGQRPRRQQRPAMRRPAQKSGYQAKRAPSRTSTYNDWAPMAKGGYGYKPAY